MSLLSVVHDYGLCDTFWARKNNTKREKEINSIDFRRIEIRHDESPTWVCFLPWRVDSEQAQKLGIIPKKGRVIIYEGPIGIAHSNPIVTCQLLKELVADVVSLKLSDFNVLSLSIGNYLGFYVANHFSVNKFVSVMPGSRLGDCIYDGVATRSIKEKAILLGIKDANEYNMPILGTNPIDNLAGLPKDTEIHIATHDLYIPTKHGEELIVELEKIGNPKVQRYKNKGHVLTLLQFGKHNPY